MICAEKDKVQRMISSLEEGHCSRRIKSHYFAYGTGYDFARLFTVKKGGCELGLISVFNSAMTVSNFEDKGFDDEDIEELAQFVFLNKPESVEISPEYADKMERYLKGCYFSITRNELCYAHMGCEALACVDENPRLETAFNILSEAFEELKGSEGLWITEASHRIRHGISRFFTLENAAAAMVVYAIDGTAFVEYVGTRAKLRNRHFAERLLRFIGEKYTAAGFEVRLFACDELVEFYERIGFERIGQDKILQLYERERI